MVMHQLEDGVNPIIYNRPTLIAALKARRRLDKVAVWPCYNATDCPIICDNFTRVGGPFYYMNIRILCNTLTLIASSMVMRLLEDVVVTNIAL